MTTIAVRHIVDWGSGESYFAIVCGPQILKRLTPRNWTQATAAYRAFKRERLS